MFGTKITWESEKFTATEWESSVTLIGGEVITGYLINHGDYYAIGDVTIPRHAVLKVNLRVVPHEEEYSTKVEVITPPKWQFWRTETRIRHTSTHGYYGGYLP